MEPEGPGQALRRSRSEPAAFGVFYRAHAESLLAHITRRVYDLDTASDLAAESFARAYLKRRSFRGNTDAEAAKWLYVIATRETAQYFRRGAIERRALRRLGLEGPLLTEEEQARVLDLAEIDELRGIVRMELESLTTAQREALRLRVVDELAYEEVADRLGISQDAARARVARGLSALAAGLDRIQAPLIESKHPLRRG